MGINVPEFKKLWEADKTEDKGQYARELAYVYHMCDFESPYFDVFNKQEEIAKAYIGKGNYSPPKRVKDCIEMYEKMQYTAERRSLNAALALCESISSLAEQNGSDSKQMNDLMEKLDKTIKSSSDVFEEMSMIKEKMEVRKQAIDLANAATNLITKLEKNIDSIIALRIKVLQNVYSDVDNSRSINNSLMDELLDEI